MVGGEAGGFEQQQQWQLKAEDLAAMRMHGDVLGSPTTAHLLYLQQQQPYPQQQQQQNPYLQQQQQQNPYLQQPYQQQQQQQNPYQQQNPFQQQQDPFKQQQDLYTCQAGVAPGRQAPATGARGRSGASSPGASRGSSGSGGGGGTKFEFHTDIVNT
jgi:hypothetical protein